MSVTVICGKGAFWVLLYLLGYFALDLKICFLLAAGGYILLRSSKGGVNKQKKESKQEFPSRHHLPAWVLHPDTERSEWVNCIIKQLWPFLEAYVREFLHSLEKDQGLRASLRNYGVESIRFPSFTLGSIPPRITGVKVHTSVHRREIIMDINLDYAGDSEIVIILGVKPPILSNCDIPLRAGLSNISIKSNLRLHLAPLLRDTPFVGSVALSFLDNPELDFALGGIVKILDFPGIEALLKKCINGHIEEHYVNPNSLKIKLGATSERVSSSFISSRRLDEGGTHSLCIPKGVLRITLVEAKGLENKDVNLIGCSSNKSDPYATLEVMVDSRLHTFKTEVVANNLHPNWNYNAELIIDDPESLDRILVHIWDKDSSKDDFLGKCELSYSGVKTAIETGTTQEFWTILEDVQRGSLHSLVSWSLLSLQPPTLSNEADTNNAGVLVIEIDSCLNLLGGRISGLKLPNPKVVVELCGVVQETEVVSGSSHPVFEHRMSFFVSNPKVDSLKISVMDTRKANKSVFGTLRLSISDFLGNKSLSLLNQRFSFKSQRMRPEKETPSIVLSGAFRYIQRVPSAHSSSPKRLKELHKKLTASSSVHLEDSSPPAWSLSPPKNLSFNSNLHSDDINNNSLPEVESLVSLELNPSLTVPDLISASTKYNLHLPKTKLPDYRAKLRLSTKYNSQTKTLSVVVHQGKNIPVFPQSNIGVKTYLLEELPMRLIRRLKHGKRKTKTQKTPEPTFEETLEYYLQEQDLLYRKLEVNVEIHKGLRVRSIGQFIVDLVPLASNASITKWYPLKLSDRYGGEQSHHRGLPKIIKFSPTHSLKIE